MTGWVVGRESTSTPNGDQVVFGEAVDSKQKPAAGRDERALHKMRCDSMLAW